MKIIIVGAVAAGTSAAAKARRNDEDAQITLYDRDEHISYSGCGLPYYIGGELKDFGDLIPRDAAYFKKKYNVDVLTRHEVLGIDSTARQVTVKRMEDGFVFQDHYDALILATGASPVVPPIPGADQSNVFLLRTPSHAAAIKEYIRLSCPKQAVIAGSGFIGMEMAESLTMAGLSVTVVEKLPQVCPALDSDMALYLQDHLGKNGCRVITGHSVAGIMGDRVVLDDGSELEGGIVILAVGVKPNVKLAVETGVEIGPTGAIRVDSKMQTNLPGVYACGDCAESWSVVDGQSLYRPLGSTANKMGRIAGDGITGGSLAFRGIAGTGIFKVFDLSVATTGLGEAEARRKGYDVVTCLNIKLDRPEYFQGREMIIKAVADRATERLLGVQIVGYGGVDKRIDVFVTAMTYGARVTDLFHLDLAYAPPFSTTKDPVHYTGMILDNAINRGRELVDHGKLMEQGEAAFTLIDARSAKQYDAGHVEQARSIPQEDLRRAAKTLPQDKPVVVYCNKGVTGNAAQNILLNCGFPEVYNLSGGYTNYKKQKDG